MVRADSGAGDTLRRRVAELLGPEGDEAATATGTAAAEDGASSAGRAAAVRRLGAGLARFGREHLVVVAIIALAGCAWAGVSLTQAQTVPVAVASAAPTGPATLASTPPPRIVVHVLGAVASPGIVRLPQGSRVDDAIAAAGGLRSDARPGELNLAAVVADGSQLVIGTAAEPGGQVRGAGAGSGGTGGAGGGGASGLVNLNTATVEQLDTLPGVGPVTAQAIVAWREKHGRFSRVEELQEIDGIGPKTFSQLAAKVTVG